MEWFKSWAWMRFTPLSLSPSRRQAQSITVAFAAINSGLGIKLGGSPAANPGEGQKARCAKIDQSIEPTLAPLTKMFDIL